MICVLSLSVLNVGFSHVTTSNLIDFDVYFFENKDGPEIKQYSKSYKDKLYTIFKSELKPSKKANMNFINTSNWTNEEKDAIEVIKSEVSRIVIKEEGDGMFSMFKKSANIDKNMEYRRAVGLIGENKNLDEISFIMVQGHAYNNVSKQTGTYSDEARGYLVYFYATINTHTIQPSFVHIKFPENNGTRFTEREVLTDKRIKKYMRRFNDEWRTNFIVT